MNLLEYIKMSYLRPNKRVLKGLGASDDLIAYLMETPRNTNIVIANQLIGSNNETDEGLVIIDGTPDAMYQSGGDYTSIGFVFESEPTTLANIKVGTTFTVEINNQSYDFTIAIVNTESGNRNYASAQSATVPSFSLSDTIEGFACQMAIEGDVRLITHFKVIQTSDYEPVVIPTVASLRIDKNPDKVEYVVGEELNYTGISITLVYSDGTEEGASEDPAITFDPDWDTTATIDMTSVTVTHTTHNVSATFAITVTEQPALMTSITVTPPTKTVYNVGDTLDLTGMVVTGNLDNGETIIITEDCSVTTTTGGSTLTTSDVKVIVRYFELTDNFAITVNSL